MNKITHVEKEFVRFDDGSKLYSNHDSDCCEIHYLSFGDLSVADFEGLSFDLSSDGFFRKVEDYGIMLVPVSGHPVPVPGYGFNNGYYSSELTLILERDGSTSSFDISKCQVIHD